uniref:Gem-associated protein 8 n=1 Tax=Timema cristinae TaxID=61476 RepID=A0A7R9CWX3_TIMCR|nr:unnamed protein product [Timema cristinae]
MQEGNSNEVSSTSLNSLQQQSYKKKKRKYNKKTSNLPELGRKPDVELSHPFGTVFNFDKFWKSYHNAFNWHRRHDVAYWKAQAAALGYENKVLHDYIRLLLSVTNQGPTYPFTGVLNPSQYVRPFQTPDTSTISLASSKKRRGRKRKNRNRKRKRKLSVKEETSEDSEIDEENLDFEVDEGMMEFLKKSLQFKLEQKKLQQLEDNHSTAAVPLQEQVGLKRQQEAKAMYGESAPKLLAMETAMQLTFDRYCDKNQPQMWPVISLCF